MATAANRQIEGNGDHPLAHEGHYLVLYRHIPDFVVLFQLPYHFFVNIPEVLRLSFAEAVVGYFLENKAQAG